MKLIPKIIIGLLIAAIICIAAGYLVARNLISPVTADPSAAVTARIKVPSGSTFTSVGRMLEEEGIIKSAKAFYYYAKLSKNSIRAGVYRVDSSMSVKEIQDLFSSGKQEQITVSIPEGYTLKQIATIMEENEAITSREDFISECSNKALLAEYSIPADSFEGYLFPDTYYLNPYTDSATVIRMLADRFFQQLKTIPAYNGMSSDELFYYVRLASVVEKEYKVADEAPMISSVFTNRLNTISRGHSMGLYSCATVVYIITDILDRPHPDKVTTQDTKIDNPYNTYLYEGLPPGAISNPGLIALNAAVNPAKTNYKYFVVDGNNEGRHIFSVSLEEHNKAKN